jgi:hypothetical protein
MAKITISDIRPAGSDLFMDSESYLHDVTSEDELAMMGGRWFKLLWTALCWG